MSTTSSKIYNPSFVSGSHFLLNISGFDNLNFNIQSCNLPAVTSNIRQITTPSGDTPYSGDHLDYEVFEISIIHDESLNAFKEIYNWIRALNPTHFLNDSEDNQYLNWEKNNGDLYRNASLFILTNSLHINVEVKFFNLFPFHISGLDFKTTDTEDRKLFSTISFAYSYYNIITNPEYNLEGYVTDNIKE